MQGYLPWEASAPQVGGGVWRRAREGAIDTSVAEMVD